MIQYLSCFKKGEIIMMKKFIKQFERHLRSKINLFILVASQSQL